MTVFNSTEQALNYTGDLSEIRELRKLAKKWAKKHIEKGNYWFAKDVEWKAWMYYNMSFISATHAQLYRECLENKQA